jgi:hypothetical protein
LAAKYLTLHWFALLSKIYLRIKTLLQMIEEISKEVGVGVLAELIQNKPVTKITYIKDTLASGKVSISESSSLDENQDISQNHVC